MQVLGLKLVCCIQQFLPFAGFSFQVFPSKFFMYLNCMPSLIKDQVTPSLLVCFYDYFDSKT